MMKRVVFLCSLMFICLAAALAVSGQSRAKSVDKVNKKEKVCSFSIVGMWRSDITLRTNSIFFDFSPEGYVMLMGHSANALPQDFEMIESVNYKLNSPDAPKSIEFVAINGNDAFPQGITTMDIVQYSDDSFTTRDLASGQKMQWTRERTHRYFLTFAARRAPLPLGGPVFAMWTAMDGRTTEVEALGIQLIKDDEGKLQPVFGSIPDAVYNPIIEDSDKNIKNDKAEIEFMRIELTSAEFEKTHKLYKTWDEQVKQQKLPSADPYLNGLEFLKQVAESFNQCGEKVKLLSLTQRERDEMVAKHELPQFLLEYVKAMRKKNGDMHVSNAVFPWGWRPMVQLNGQ